MIWRHPGSNARLCHHRTARYQLSHYCCALSVAPRETAIDAVSALSDCFSARLQNTLRRGPLLSDSPFCRCLWCWVLSFPCCAFPPSWSCTRILFSVHPGFRCDVVACTTHVTPFFTLRLLKLLSRTAHVGLCWPCLCFSLADPLHVNKTP
jgi:hypothetical protein